MISGQDGHKPHEASAFKLAEARKRGSVAKSSEFISLFALAAGATGIYLSSGGVIQRFGILARRILSRSGDLVWQSDAIAAWLATVLVDAFSILMPLFAIVCIVAVIANLVQTGPILSGEVLKADFGRLNPVEGFKKLFSIRSVFELGKSIVKFALFGGVLFMVLRHDLTGLSTLPATDPKAYWAILVALAGGLVIKLLMALALVAAVDFLFVRKQFAKQMRMSQREVKDEVKQREGDPRIRARLRELRIAMLKRSRALRRLPKADVMIVNPTHFAVALSYRRGDLFGPRIVAKGAGDLVVKMRAVAAKHRIPIVSNPPLARALFREADVDEGIAERWYPEVARILVWALAQRDQQAREARS